MHNPGVPALPEPSTPPDPENSHSRELGIVVTFWMILWCTWFYPYPISNIQWMDWFQGNKLFRKARVFDPKCTSSFRPIPGLEGPCGLRNLWPLGRGHRKNSDESPDECSTLVVCPGGQPKKLPCFWGASIYINGGSYLRGFTNITKHRFSMV